MNQALINLLAEKLQSGLVHPGDGKDVPPTGVVLPGFRTVSLGKEEKEAHNAFAKTMAEAILNEISLAGYDLIDGAEAVEMRKAVANEPVTEFSVHCHCDKKLEDPLVSFLLGRDKALRVDGKRFLSKLQRRDVQCPHKGRSR